jgi:hypothetical protein
LPKPKDSAVCSGVQTRKSLLNGDRPQCPIDPQHPIHCHGNYDRFANCHEKTKSKWIDRFLCYLCGHTISVLPDDTLPYRPISVAQLEASFDAKAAGQPEPPASPVERGCLKRAWLRFHQRLNALTLLLGQMLQTRQSTDAKRIWPQLRRLGNLDRILHLLGRKFKTSLLLDYRCLKPWPVPAEPGG